MNTQNIYHKYLHTLLYVSACVIVMLFLFFIFSPSVYASHPSAPNPCVQGDNLGDRGTPDGTQGGIVPIPGPIFGIHVPVKDFEAEALLRSIARNIRIIALNTIAIERDTNLIEKDTQAIRYYLRLLCDKEYDLDHTLQHDWMEVMGKFIDRTLDWILTAYNGNPIFVTNPHVYYRNVDLGITEAMRLDVDDSEIDEDLKLILMRTLENTEVELLFPDYIGETLTPIQKAIFDNRKTFTWDAWIAATMRPENNLYDLSSLVEQELQARRAQAREIERDKLLWGRGFFPMEICGQQVFSKRPEDIRTCETLTPGSLIQDLSSLILGSVVRQIENADEYEEWISGAAFLTFNDVFSTSGIVFGLGSNIPRDPASPTDTEVGLQSVITEEQAAAAISNANIDKAKSLYYYNAKPLVFPGF